MAFLPPDVRTARPFRIIKGLDDNLIRTDYAVDSGVTSIDSGEWVVLSATNQATKTSGQTLANPAQNVALNWTKFERNNTSTGQSDAAVLEQITCVSGSYQAETTFVETTGTFTPGFLLVVRESTTVAGQGVLDAVDGASATAEQIAAAVGKVISFSGGRLTYRSLGVA